MDTDMAPNIQLHRVSKPDLPKKRQEGAGLDTSHGSKQAQ